MPRASLDAEFLFLLTFLRTAFAATSPELREHARVWLQRLCQVPARTDIARRDRNEYLSRLYHGMLTNHLDSVFLDEPPEGVLKPPHQVFPDVDMTAWMAKAATGYDADRGCGDADERTYLSTQLLPGGRGAFGYLAVSLASGGPHWESRTQDTSGWRHGDPQATSTPLAPDSPSARAPSPSQEGASGVGAMLGARPPAERRQQLLDFYDSLIDTLDQAMAEPEKPSPEVDKILSSFQVYQDQDEDPSAAADSSDAAARHLQLLPQLRERLEKCRERAEQRSQLLDSLEASTGAGPQLGLERQVQQVGAQHRVGAQAQRVDEDDVWNIRPDNVALLEAAYPRQLVHRFLKAIVRERVAVLGRVRAQRHYKQRVEGVEDDAAEDMDHYRDAMAAWAGVLRSNALPRQPGQTSASEDAVVQVERCADLASKVTDAMRELGAARQHYFQREDEHRDQQDHLRAEIEMLRSEDAALRRRVLDAQGAE